MTDDLFPEGGLAIARKSLVPGQGFFVPDEVQADRREERIRHAVSDSDAVVIADADADGLGCVAVLREGYDDSRAPPTISPGEIEDRSDESRPHRVALVPASPHDLTETLELVADLLTSGVDCYVCDLSPDRFEPIEPAVSTLVDTAGKVAWYDHHQWQADVETAVESAGVDLVIGDSETECSTDVVVRSIDRSVPDYLEELAAVTRDHDLWIREDTRSDDIADFAYWASPEAYVETVREYGADLPDGVMTYLATRREEKEALIERALARAEYRDIGDYTVGVTYGRCSQNEVAESMREAGADASIVVKPAGSASIRGTDTFDRCHEVAGLVNGGGHPKAAGCKPAVHDDILDYAHHWTTRGAVTKQVILDAFRTVVESPAED